MAKAKPAASHYAPYSTETEQSVLGCCLTDSRKMEAAASRLKPETFHDPFHQRMFGTMLRLMQPGAGGVSALTVHAALKADPGLVTLNMDYIEVLADAAPRITRLDGMLDLLLDLADRRQLEEIGKSLTYGAYETPSEAPTTALAGQAMEALLAIGQETSRPAVTPYAVAGRVLDRAEAHQRGDKPPAVTTGLKKVNKAIGGGLQATDFMGVAGRSGMGKSGLLRSISLAAARAETPTLFFSTEMSAEQLTQAMLTDLDFGAKLQDEAKIETWKFRAGCLTTYEITRLRQAMEALEALPFEICDDADLTMGAIRQRSRAFQSRHKGKLILVVTDFLQNIVDEERTAQDNRENSINRLAYGHKKLAKTLDCAVLAAIQLRNKGDGKTPRDALPNADMIRESGAIEMACDILVAPYRKAFFLKGEEPAASHDDPKHVAWKEKYDAVKNDLWLRGFKNRHGDPGALNLELWCDLSVGAIRDDRPGRYRLPAEGEEIPASELRF